MLLVDDVLNELNHSKFLTLNLQSGFWQIWMETKKMRRKLMLLQNKDCLIEQSCPLVYKTQQVPLLIS
jgi:hypothetical protein